MALSLLLTGPSLFAQGEASGESSQPAPLLRRRAWSQVRSWVYQLQHLKLESLRNAPADLLVIDFSRNGSEEQALSRGDVKTLQDSGKLVVSYLSIGEAEPYRFYWKKGWKPGNPDWIQRPNPSWPDNFPVEFWHPAWKKILYGSPEAYLDRILAAGFDGVYLDIVDGYEAFMDSHDAPDRKMIDLVKDLARYARERAGHDFGVFPQNAIDLLEQPDYLEVLTGLGKEETYFFPGDKPNAKEDRLWEEELLGKLTGSGKLVLTVDYCHKEKNRRWVQERARKLGFVPYLGPVSLNRIEPQPE